MVCLVLLRSGPDTVHSISLHKTLRSTPLIGNSFPYGTPRTAFSPAVADCGYRAPLAPHLARLNHYSATHRKKQAFCAKVFAHPENSVAHAASLWYTGPMAKRRVKFTTEPSKRKKSDGHSDPWKQVSPRPNVLVVDAMRQKYADLDGVPGRKPDGGKPIYRYSSARTMYDVDGKRARKSPATAALSSVAALLTLWVLFSLIYRSTTESNVGAVWLSMLPSLIITVAIIVTVVISALGQWGKVGRFALKHGLYRHGNPAYIRALGEDFKRADANAYCENAVTVTKETVTLTLYGKPYTFGKAAVTAAVRRENGALHVVFRVDGHTVDFPEPIAADDFYLLKKAFGKQLTTVRQAEQNEVERDGKGRRTYGGYSLGNVVVAACMSTVILVAGVMLTVAHYVWGLPVPPFLGVFFAMMSLLAYGNTFSHIPAVNVVAIPLSFSLVLLVVPPWIFVWYETELAKNALTFWGVLTHADVFPVGMAFFSFIGVYVLVFAVGRLIDYVRFGVEK